MTKEKMERAKEIEREIKSLEIRIKENDREYCKPYYSIYVEMYDCGFCGNENRKIMDIHLKDDEAIAILDIIRKRNEGLEEKLIQLKLEYEKL